MAAFHLPAVCRQNAGRADFKIEPCRPAFQDRETHSFMRTRAWEWGEVCPPIGPVGNNNLKEKAYEYY